MGRRRHSQGHPADGVFIERHRDGRVRGYRAYVRVRGRLIPKRFPPDATLDEMQRWREDTRRVERLMPALAPTPPRGFAGDALRYLETVKAMPSIADRRLHVHDWMAVFVDRPHEDITSTEIRAQRDRWLTTGPRRERQRIDGAWRSVLVPKPLSPHSVNLRLRALENLWTVLWPNTPNPVRDVPECDEPEARARGESFAIIEELLAAAPARTRPVKGVKGSADGPSKSRARIAVMLWTGLAHSQVAQLDEHHHVDYAAMTYIRPRRRKGRRGQRNRTATTERPRPLLPQAAEALKHFFAIGAAGPFSRSSLHSSFKRWIVAANEARVRAHQEARRRGTPALIPMSLRPYDVKHTFGSEAYRASGNIRAVQELLGLSRLELADRYAHAAIAPVAAQAAAAMAHLVDQGRKSAGVTRGKVTPSKKSRKSA